MTAASTCPDDLPPPLEDCSQLFQQRQQERAEALRSRDKAASKMKQAMAEVAATASNSRSLMTTQNATTTRRTDGSSLKDDSFASGLRSGFLLDGVCAKKTSKSTASAPSKDKADDTPGIIKPKKSGDDDSTSTLRLDEVQKALHSELLDKKDWMTDDFMQKLSNDPAIGTLFRASSSSSSEPSDVERAIDMFASNPGEAMKRYGHRADIMNALRAFAGHFGEHLGKMGDLEEEARKVASEDVEREAVAHVGKAPSSGSDISEFFQIPNDLPEHERVLVRRVLSDKDVKNALRDPAVQKLLHTLKTDPRVDSAALLRGASTDVREKLQHLMRVGLLQIQR